MAAVSFVCGVQLCDRCDLEGQLAYRQGVWLCLSCLNETNP